MDDRANNTGWRGGGRTRTTLRPAPSIPDIRQQLQNINLTLLTERFHTLLYDSNFKNLRQTWEQHISNLQQQPPGFLNVLENDLLHHNHIVYLKLYEFYTMFWHYYDNMSFNQRIPFFDRIYWIWEVLEIERSSYPPPVQDSIVETLKREPYILELENDFLVLDSHFRSNFQSPEDAERNPQGYVPHDTNYTQRFGNQGRGYSPVAGITLHPKYGIAQYTDHQTRFKIINAPDAAQSQNSSRAPSSRRTLISYKPPTIRKGGGDPQPRLPAPQSSVPGMPPSPQQTSLLHDTSSIQWFRDRKAQLSNTIDKTMQMFRYYKKLTDNDRTILSRLKEDHNARMEKLLQNLEDRVGKKLEISQETWLQEIEDIWNPFKTVLISMCKQTAIANLQAQPNISSEHLKTNTTVIDNWDPPLDDNIPAYLIRLMRISNNPVRSTPPDPKTRAQQMPPTVSLGGDPAPPQQEPSLLTEREQITWWKTKRAWYQSISDNIQDKLIEEQFIQGDRIDAMQTFQDTLETESDNLGTLIQSKIAQNPNEPVSTWKGDFKAIWEKYQEGVIDFCRTIAVGIVQKRYAAKKGFSEDEYHRLHTIRNYTFTGKPDALLGFLRNLFLIATSASTLTKPITPDDSPRNSPRKTPRGPLPPLAHTPRLPTPTGLRYLGEPGDGDADGARADEAQIHLEGCSPWSLWCGRNDHMVVAPGPPPKEQVPATVPEITWQQKIADRLSEAQVEELTYDTLHYARIRKYLPDTITTPVNIALLQLQQVTQKTNDGRNATTNPSQILQFLDDIIETLQKHETEVRKTSKEYTKTVRKTPNNTEKRQQRTKSQNPPTQRCRYLGASNYYDYDMENMTGVSLL